MPKQMKLRHHIPQQVHVFIRKLTEEAVTCKERVSFAFESLTIFNCHKQITRMEVDDPLHVDQVLKDAADSLVIDVCWIRTTNPHAK